MGLFGRGFHCVRAFGFDEKRLDMCVSSNFHHNNYIFNDCFSFSAHSDLILSRKNENKWPINYTSRNQYTDWNLINICLSHVVCCNRVRALCLEWRFERMCKNVLWFSLEFDNLHLVCLVFSGRTTSAICILAVATSDRRAGDTMKCRFIGSHQLIRPNIADFLNRATNIIKMEREKY